MDDIRAVEWLEFPWEVKTQHIDAMVYSPKFKAVFYIEAKRFTTKSKVGAIAKDINLLISSNKDFMVAHGIQEIEHEFVIALSDVWLETKWKRSVPFWWAGDDLPEQVLRWSAKSGKSLIQVDSTFQDQLMMEYKVDWSPSKQHIYWLGETVEKVENYCLLMGYKKII